VPGRLFVITGRRTFSAAQMLVTELRKYSSAVFVGEPTASKGNHYGDSFRIVMPNSRVTVRVSTLWHQYVDSRDTRAMIEPAIAAPLAFADYAAGRDPALAAVRARVLP
jgi:C-terminal processing protease CtpA/Prc